MGYVRCPRTRLATRRRPGRRRRPGDRQPAAATPSEPVKALLVAVDFLEAQVDELRAAISTSYARRRYDVRRDRKE
jgi:hypothetical protein